MTCAYCGTDIAAGEPMSYMGASVAHKSRQTCCELLKARIAQLEKHHEHPGSGASPASTVSLTTDASDEVQPQLLDDGARSKLLLDAAELLDAARALLPPVKLGNMAADLRAAARNREK